MIFGFFHELSGLKYWEDKHGDRTYVRETWTGRKYEEKEAGFKKRTSDSTTSGINDQADTPIHGGYGRGYSGGGDIGAPADPLEAIKIITVAVICWFPFTLVCFIPTGIIVECFGLAKGLKNVEDTAVNSLTMLYASGLTLYLLINRHRIASIIIATLILIFMIGHSFFGPRN